MRRSGHIRRHLVVSGALALAALAGCGHDGMGWGSGGYAMLGADLSALNARMDTHLAQMASHMQQMFALNGGMGVRGRRTPSGCPQDQNIVLASVHLRSYALPGASNFYGLCRDAASS